MGNFHEFLFSSIPPNKFCPPSVTPGLCIARPRLLDREARHEERLTMIDAQAGQGKSTLAAQIVSVDKKPYVWFRVGPEDADPALFISSLYYGFSSTFTRLKLPILETILNGSGLSDNISTLNTILWHISNQLNQDFTVVFDDIYFLPKDGETLMLLQYLIKSSPDSLSFILTTRERAVMDKLGLAKQHSRYIGNADLAFSETETSELLNSVLSHEITPSVVRKLQSITDGWAMGLVFFSKNAERYGIDDFNIVKANTEIFDYFENMVSELHSRETLKDLYKLSHLREIPLALAAQLSEHSEVIDVLKKLADKNLFVGELKTFATTYVFHHLFREYLTLKSLSLLESTELESIYEQAGEYYYGLDKKELALEYYIKAGQIEKTLPILSEHGLAMLAKGYGKTVSKIMDAISKNRLDDYPWCSLLQAYLLFERIPVDSMSYLKCALKGFSLYKDEKGELLSLVQICHYHVWIDGSFQYAAPHIARIEHLVDKVDFGDDLIAYAKVLIDFGATVLFVESQSEKAMKFLQEGVEIAEHVEYINLSAVARVYIGYCKLFRGDFSETADELEKAWVFLQNRNISMVSQVFIRCLALNYLEFKGDVYNFDFQISTLRQVTDERFYNQSIAAIFVVIWKADSLVSRGKYRQAYHCLLKGFDSQYAATHAHLRSQLLYHRAFISAILGSYDEANAAVAEAIALREKVGGDFFLALAYCVSGFVYTETGKIDKAVELYDRALTVLQGISKQQTDFWLLEVVYFYRSYSYLMQGEGEKAEVELRRSLKLMQEFRHDNFFLWTPHVAEPVLRFALEQEIEREFASSLMKYRLGLGMQQGRAVPMLYIKTLGGLGLEIGGLSIDAAKILTQNQRKLLGILLSSDGLYLEQAEVEEAMWPDGKKEASRAKFDTLLSRLRKALQSEFRHFPINHYICMDRGILALENCVVDMIQFKKFVNKGLDYTKSDQPWQSSNCFRRAKSYWRGNFLPGLVGAYSISDKRDELALLHARMLQVWSEFQDVDNEADAPPECLSALGASDYVTNKNTPLPRHSNHVALEDN